MTTDFCSRCRLPFKTSRGYVRFHDDQQGNVCPGSGLEPWVDIWAPWADGGAA